MATLQVAVYSTRSYDRHALGHGHRRLFHVSGLAIDFYAVLFVAATGNVDFRAEVEQLADQADAGELEMF